MRLFAAAGSEKSRDMQVWAGQLARGESQPFQIEGKSMLLCCLQQASHRAQILQILQELRVVWSLNCFCLRIIPSRISAWVPFSFPKASLMSLPHLELQGCFHEGCVVPIKGVNKIKPFLVQL